MLRNNILLDARNAQEKRKATREFKASSDSFDVHFVHGVAKNKSKQHVFLKQTRKQKVLTYDIAIISHLPMCPDAECPAGLYIIYTFSAPDSHFQTFEIQKKHFRTQKLKGFLIANGRINPPYSIKKKLSLCIHPRFW